MVYSQLPPLISGYNQVPIFNTNILARIVDLQLSNEHAFIFESIFEFRIWIRYFSIESNLLTKKSRNSDKKARVFLHYVEKILSNFLGSLHPMYKRHLLNQESIYLQVTQKTLELDIILGFNNRIIPFPQKKFMYTLHILK